MWAFARHVNAFPWQWSSAMVEWLGDLRSLRELKRSTIRSYSEVLRACCEFATDPACEWAAICAKHSAATRCRSCTSQDCVKVL